MNCEEFKKKISIKFDGALSQKESKLVEEHLKTCSSCKSFESSLLRLSESLKIWQGERLPSFVEQRLFSKLLEKSQKAKIFGISFGYYKIPAPVAWVALFFIAIFSFSFTYNVISGKKESSHFKSLKSIVEKQKQDKIFITSKDIISETTSYKSINP